MTANTVTRRRGGPTGGTAVANIVMIVGLVYFLAPIVWLTLAVTKTNGNLYDSFGFWFAAPFHVVQNLEDLLARDNGAYLTWMTNSAIYAVTASILATLVSALAGYAFAIYDFRGRNVVFALVIGTVFVPQSVFAVPLFYMMSGAGLSGSLLAVILPAIVYPFGVYLMRIYAEKAIPTELLDAGRIDGASEFRIFRSVSFRLLAPGVVTVLLLSFVTAWNNYFLPLLLLSDPNSSPLTVGLANWNSQATLPGQIQNLYAIIITGSFVAIIPVMVAFLAVQRYWQGGLAVGGVKE